MMRRGALVAVALALVAGVASAASPAYDVYGCVTNYDGSSNLFPASSMLVPSSAGAVQATTVSRRGIAAHVTCSFHARGAAI